METLKRSPLVIVTGMMIVMVTRTTTMRVATIESTKTTLQTDPTGERTKEKAMATATRGR